MARLVGLKQNAGVWQEGRCEWGTTGRSYTAEHSWQQEQEAQHRDVVPSQLPTEQRVQ